MGVATGCTFVAEEVGWISKETAEKAMCLAIPADVGFIIGAGSGVIWPPDNDEEDRKDLRQ